MKKMRERGGREKERERDQKDSSEKSYIILYKQKYYLDHTERTFL